MRLSHADAVVVETGAELLRKLYHREALPCAEGSHYSFIVAGSEAELLLLVVALAGFDSGDVALNGGYVPLAARAVKRVG